MTKVLKLTVFVLSGLLVLSCAANSNGEPVKAQKELPTVELRAGSVTVVAELARSPEEQTAGLMFRKSLADGRGMLFVYEDDRRLSFYMKNTLVPLSIAFLAADGTIRGIYNMEPRSLKAVNSMRSVRYALEVPQGWFDRAGLVIGDRFEIPQF
ncbi:MAG: DUF192 domain-containing protein [Spirochaetota bacterium]